MGIAGFQTGYKLKPDDTWESIPGWFAEPEFLVIRMLCREMVSKGISKIAVEIGAYCGRSTAAIGTIMKECGGRLYTIDPWDGRTDAKSDPVGGVFEYFLDNMRRCGLFADGGAVIKDVVVPIRGRSYQVDWRRSIGLLFIDGFHEYENAARDFGHFAPYVEPGGYVVFHDYPGFGGVARVIRELEAKSGWKMRKMPFSPGDPDYSLAVFERMEV